MDKPKTRRSESIKKAGLIEIICNGHILYLNLSLKPRKPQLKINDANPLLWVQPIWVFQELHLQTYCILVTLHGFRMGINLIHATEILFAYFEKISISIALKLIKISSVSMQTWNHVSANCCLALARTSSFRNDTFNVIKINLKTNSAMLRILLICACLMSFQDVILL